MAEKWITKHGSDGRPLVLGLNINDALVDFSALTDPVLRVRRNFSNVVLEFPVVSYTDSANTPALYNAAVFFSGDDWDDLTPGDYIAEVVADYASLSTVWPGDEYIKIKVLQGAAAG